MSNKYIKSLQEVDSINILEFNIEKKNWIYIGNYNIVIEKTELLGSVLNLIKEGMCEKDIIDKLKSKFQEGEVNEQLNVLIKTFQEDNIRKEKSKKIFKVTQDSWENGNAVVGLFLNVSNDCNLRCTYCYGDGGNYGSDRTLMTQDTAKKNIDYWFKHLNMDQGISVEFFGGEPLMNKNVVIYAVNYINEYLNKYNKKAFYCITTNGTILDYQILDLFKNNHFGVTMSIDGGEEIQNKNRPFASGKGTFEVVKKNVKLLKENNISVTARLTITHENVSTFCQCVKEIWETGINKVTFDPVVSDNKKLNLTIEDIEILRVQLNELMNITYDNILNERSQVLRRFIDIGSSIFNKRFVQTCCYNSMRGLMVSSQGEFFRCHRLLENRDFIVGNRESGLDWDKYTRKNNLSLKCKGCWAENACDKCAHANYTFTGDTENPDKLWCAFRKIIAEESLKLYIKISLNLPEKVQAIY